MKFIKEVAPFYEGIHAIKATYPEVYIKYKFEKNKPGYIKTATLDLLVFKFEYDNRPTVYIIKDMNGKEVYDIGEVYYDVKFYTIEDKVLVKSSCSVIIYKNGENILRELANFQNSMFGISNLHEYEGSLYYLNNCINNYKTLITFVDYVFYRICYNTKEYFIIVHSDSEERNNKIFDYSKIVTVDPDLSYLFDDLQNLSKEKFAEYCQIIDVDGNYNPIAYGRLGSKNGKFTKIDRALLYIKYYLRLQDINMTANTTVIENITNEIKTYPISRDKLKEHAKLFV